MSIRTYGIRPWRLRAASLPSYDNLIDRQNGPGRFCRELDSPSLRNQEV